MKHITYNNLNNQLGVTLLLAVMIMAGLTLITLAVGTFAIDQLRSSRATVITEPAIAAAESGGEQGLWAIKRTGTLPTCPTLTTQTLANNSLINSCESFTAATFTVHAGIAFTFYLYDPGNINGDTDLSGYPYAWMSLTNVAGTNAVSMTIQRLDGSSTGLAPSAATVAPSNSQTVTITPVPVGTEGRMKITLTSSGDNTVTVNTDRGMPSFPTIDSTGCSAKTAIANCTSTGQEIFSRRINVTVPQ